MYCIATNFFFLKSFIMNVHNTDMCGGFQLGNTFYLIRR